MLFNSLAYLIFLPITVILFWLVPFKFRTALLLVASYVFYMSWKPVYGLLMLGLTAVNYLLGILISRGKAQKKIYLTAGIVVNLLTLGYFKYAYFAHGMMGDLVHLAGLKKVPDMTISIILPLGISFFVFEFIHYLVDVYRGGQPVLAPLEFALFPSFFPTQIAGPIKRYQDFVAQLKVPQKLSRKDFDEGIELILFGLFKKVILADNISVVVNRCYAHPDLLTGVDALIAVWLFAFQIYFDFSGYTDIARGSALLLGFRVPLNFNLPFMAGSMTELWHRWHMTLSSWLRDYLYIPLGGSRKGQLITLRNLLITMTLGGLWHGASMHFVCWGMLMGSMLIAHRLWQIIVSKSQLLTNMVASTIYKCFAIFLTFNCFAYGFVLFRAENMTVAWKMLAKAFFLDAAPKGLLFWQPSIINSTGSPIYLLLPILLLTFFLGQIATSCFRGTPGVMPAPQWLPGFKAIYLAGLVIALLLFSPDMTPQFIYFQF